MTPDFPFPKDMVGHCISEYVYFARPDSNVFGRSVLGLRLEIGRRLARESPVPARVMVPVPDSGMGAAMGYVEESGLPYVIGLVRNHGPTYRGQPIVRHRSPSCAKSTTALCV